MVKGISAVSRGYGRQYFDSRVRPYIHDYMGLIFEAMCRDYTFDMSMKGVLKTEITEIGHWRGHDDLLRETSDIDVLGIDRTNRTAVIGECKFRNKKPEKNDFEKLIHRGELLKGYSVEERMFFSLAEVEKDMKADYEKKGIRFIRLNEIYTA